MGFAGNAPHVWLVFLRSRHNPELAVDNILGLAVGVHVRVSFLLDDCGILNHRVIGHNVGLHGSWGHHLTAHWLRHHVWVITWLHLLIWVHHLYPLNLEIIIKLKN